MRNRLAILIPLLMLVAELSGCVTPSVGPFHFLGDSNNSASIDTPPDFDISPQQAMKIFRRCHGVDGGCFDIYSADNQYFIIDASDGETSIVTTPFGARIDGNSGQIFDDESSTWISIPPWRPPTNTESTGVEKENS